MGGGEEGGGTEENTLVERSKLQRHKITQMNIPHTHTHTHKNHRKPTIEMLSCCPTVNVRRHHRCCFYFRIFSFLFDFFLSSFLQTIHTRTISATVFYLSVLEFFFFFRCLSFHWLLFKCSLVLPLIFRRSSSSPINLWFLRVVFLAHRLKQKNMKKRTIISTKHLLYLCVFLN